LGIVGSSRTSHLGLPLPYDLGAAGAPGCAILSSPESLVYVATASIPWSIPIPAKPRLAGSVFFNQLLVLRASANPLGLLTSSGRACTVGF
jgi:hypothetical protein